MARFMTQSSCENCKEMHSGAREMRVMLGATFELPVQIVDHGVVWSAPLPVLENGPGCWAVP